MITHARRTHTKKKYTKTINKHVMKRFNKDYYGAHTFVKSARSIIKPKFESHIKTTYMSMICIGISLYIL